MDENNKAVLLISYDWPPSAEVGAVRGHKIGRYIARHGWAPTILTVKESYYERVFTEKDVSPFPLFRTHCMPSPLKAYAYAKRFMGKLRKLAPTRPLMNDQRRPVLKKQRGLMSALGYGRRLVLSLLYMPDEFQGWLPIAFLKGRAVIKANNISHIITTGPPFTTHLIGLVLKKWKGEQIKWIADFRDPWVASEQRSEVTTTSVSNYFNKFLERQVVTQADRIVCVTASMTDWYRKRYPFVLENVWQTISNGFESDEFNGTEIKRGKKFTISYVGSIEYERSPRALLKAVAELCTEGVFDREKISIRFIGKCGWVQNRPMMELVQEFGLEGIVELVGLVPRPAALREMELAHIVLLLANSQELQVPGKAYEYIGAGSFILAVTEEHGATADLIRRVGGGAIVRPDDHLAIKRVLQPRYDLFVQSSIQQKTNRELVRSAAILKDYEWNQLGDRYAKILS